MMKIYRQKKLMKFIHSIERRRLPKKDAFFIIISVCMAGWLIVILWVNQCGIVVNNEKLFQMKGFFSFENFYSISIHKITFFLFTFIFAMINLSTMNTCRFSSSSFPENIINSFLDVYVIK